MLLEKCRALTACVAALGTALMLMIDTSPAAAAKLNDLYIWAPDYYGGFVYYHQLNYATTSPAYSVTRINVSTQSCNPNSLAISGGFLYVVCSSGNGGEDQILVYNATTRSYVKTITGRGTDNNNYFTGSSLIAVLFDVHGNLWVSGYKSNDLLRIPKSQLSSKTPLVDRQVVDSPDSPAGLALDTDKSIWVVGQYDNGIVLNFADSVLNQPGTFLGATALNPTPAYCVSNDIAGCQPVGLFNSPEGVAVLTGHVYVSNNGGNAPAASLVELTKIPGGTTLSTTVIGGVVGAPFSCPGGVFAIKLPNGVNSLWVNDEGYHVANTDCGAGPADQGNSVGRVLEFTSTGLAANVAAPKPVEFSHWTQIHASSPGFGGIVIQAK
jgi:hypothetical protein